MQNYNIWGIILKLITVQVVEAQKGYFAIYELDGPEDLEKIEPIIAWRVETYEKEDGIGLYSVCTPLTVDGDVGGNCIGVQNPDLSVTVFEESTYSSLVELISMRKRKN
ncbi:hypothetical protein [Cellvibrio sp. PSBB023]|uniref:hypothetical protein n=1 Tax=Cellvibrio sp. PSBB023 TaxID=1945512 RepID=UPI00098F633C|nr:hypothetical protein [Cellvibrio sp. PSBB023]AQT59351.1 hypothetical protein B0D95_04020 [Cellvibrio sp. PSBB023]